ncbi:MAG: SGNH/GDSL hydrolase family protein [Candidatus Mariimomonas ferrooxydans]
MIKNLFVIIISLTLIIVLVEIYIRLFPPKGIYSITRFDDTVGYIYSPESKVTYNKVRYTESLANKDGYLDINHVTDGEKSRIKIGVFGDSYVEAMQVPLDKRFFRVLPQKINKNEVEYFAFGMSGFGTLHSFLNYREQDKKYNFDIVVYMFSENDPGDNSYLIRGDGARPFAKLSSSEPSFEIDSSFKKNHFKLIRSLAGKSRLFNLVSRRVSLLIYKGTKIDYEEERMMSTKNKEKIPGENDLPSTWPVNIRRDAEQLAFKILEKWAQDVRAQGKEFIVFYIPRSEHALSDNNASADTWKKWLIKSCMDLNIPLIDPSERLLQKIKTGANVYDDHWSPEGHKIVAEVFESYFSDKLKK